VLPKWSLFLKPLTTDSWLVVAAFVVISSFVLSLAQKVEDKIQLSRRHFEIEPHYSIPTGVFICSASMCLQGKRAQVLLVQ